jgi:putative pyruvate formate lyase activating enzyme
MQPTAYLLKNCSICPRNCFIDRHEKTGFCNSSEKVKISISQLHFGEEPIVSGNRGSGTIFFSNCNLRCVFCQNFKISCQSSGREYSVEELAGMMLHLQKLRAHNINLVTPSHYTPQIRDAIVIAKEQGLTLPVLWNSNAYEKPETLMHLEGLVDIFLPDFKFWYPEFSLKYSHASDYSEFARIAITEMYRQVGQIQLNKGLATKGVMIRILVMPHNLNSIELVLKWIYENFGNETYISLMGQYYPTHQAFEFKEISRGITEKEYEYAVDVLKNMVLKMVLCRKSGQILTRHLILNKYLLFFQFCDVRLFFSSVI